MAWDYTRKAPSFEGISGGSPELVSRGSSGGHKLIGLDAGAVEGFCVRGRMPGAYSTAANLGIAVNGHFAAATTGNARIRVSLERIDSSLDIDADSFDATQEVNVAATGTAGQPVSATFSLPNSDVDGVQPGEAFRLKVERVGTDGTNDTASGDFQVSDVVFSQA